VPREVRDAIRRLLWHRTTDITGDDAEDNEALATKNMDDMLIGALDLPTTKAASVNPN